MDINLEFRDRTKQIFTFKNSEEAKSFLNSEKKYWEEQKERIGPNLSGKFPNVGELIDIFMNKLAVYEKAHSDGTSDQDFGNIEEGFFQAKLQLIQWMERHWIYRGSPFTEALLAAYEHSTETGITFLETIVNKIVHKSGTPQSLDSFVGLVMAYEYLLQDESHLVKRRNSERKSFSTLRNDLEEEHKKLISEIANFKKDIGDWRVDASGSFDSWFNKTQEDTKKWIGDVKKLSDDNLSDHSKLFNLMADHVVKRTQELEELYREKLRLAAPATYWQKRAKSLSFQGGFWATLLVIASVILTAGAGAFFWAWLHKPPIPFGPQSLQGVALFGATAAAAVYLIRTLSRITFSAFHLQRDAEEREQLTHLYLALIHEGALDVKSRDIVLQALFSRADSGLLGGDHGPTMPSPTDMISAASKPRP